MIGSIDLSRSRKDKLDNPNSEVAGMSHQAGASGPRTGNGGAGLRSSIWNSPSGQAGKFMQLFRFEQPKYSSAYEQLKYHYNKSRIFPQLHTPMANPTFLPTFDNLRPRTRFRM